MKNIKLGTKLLLGGILVLAIPIIIIGTVSVYESSQSIFQMGKADMVNLAQSLASALDIGMYEQLAKIKDITCSNSVIAAAEKVTREGEKNSHNEIILVTREFKKIKDAEGDHLATVNL
jgi:hypothetical protein